MANQLAIFSSIVLYYGDTLYSSLLPRLSPHTTTMKSKEGESLVPFCTWCTAHQCYSFNGLFCYVTTRGCQLLCQQYIDREKIVLMAKTAKEVTWWYRQPGIPIQFNISTERNLLTPNSPVMKILWAQTDDCHLLHSLDFLSTSTDQDL